MHSAEAAGAEFGIWTDRLCCVVLCCDVMRCVHVCSICFGEKHVLTVKALTGLNQAKELRLT